MSKAFKLFIELSEKKQKLESKTQKKIKSLNEELLINYSEEN